MSALLSPAAIRRQFVAVATQKFASNVPDFGRLQALVARQGGHFLNDHGAIRTADPRVAALFVRAARAMGFYPDKSYRFPAKKLVSFDLQVPGNSSAEFKIFLSQVDLTAFPEEVAAVVRADTDGSWAAVDHAPLLALLDKAEAAGGLSATDTDAFVQHVVFKLMHRNGAPMARSTLAAVSAVSGEAASALALGPDFNHVTIDVRAAGFASIDVMADAMRADGYTLLPAIQGAVGTKLRQTATMAATMPTPVTEADGSVGSAPTEKQFVEIIERAQARDEDGALLWQDNGQPLIFKHFLAANAEKIFDAASTRSSTVC